MFELNSRLSPHFTTMSAGSSSAVSLDSHIDDSNKILSYIRSLHRVIGVLYEPMPTSHQSASLGVLADNYLHAHRYTPASHWLHCIYCQVFCVCWGIYQCTHYAWFCSDRSQIFVESNWYWIRVVTNFCLSFVQFITCSFFILVQKTSPAYMSALSNAVISWASHWPLKWHAKTTS